MLNERSESQTITWYMVPLTCDIQSGQIYRHRKEMSGYLGFVGGWETGGGADGCKVSFRGDENVLKLDHAMAEERWDETEIHGLVPFKCTVGCDVDSCLNKVV